MSGTCSERPASVCTSNIVVSPHPLSPITSTYSARKTPENREENHDDLQLTDEEDMQMQYSSDYLCSSSIGVVTKSHLKNLGQHRYHLKILHLSSPILVGLTDFSVVLFPKLNT